MVVLKRSYAVRHRIYVVPLLMQGNVYTSFDDYESIVNMYNNAEGRNYSPWLGSSPGFQDGPKNQALLSFGISALVIDHDGNLLILDKSNYALRKFDFGSQELSTVGRFSQGYGDGSFDQAKFSFSSVDMAIDRDGNVYILDVGNRSLRKVFLK